MIEICRVSGKSIIPYLPAVAKLRIEIFREFPYLYDGSVASEREYLGVYAESDRSVFVLAIKDGEVIGASTGLPLGEADEAFQKPFLSAGIDLGGIFYLGESVLRKSERGQGIGHEFFNEREKHAAELGFSTTAFCAVARPDDHAMKAPGHLPNDGFWEKRGYRKTPELFAELAWRQVDVAGAEVQNRLIFWLKQ